MKHLIELAKEKLNAQELGYFRMMVSQYLVLMLKAKPGTWKSAILKSIADKMDMVFIDLRLPTMDEVDLGTYPVVHYDNGLPIIKNGIPEWAYMTKDTSKNFVIVFEELNRASSSVRNAALGLLLERRIGPNFVFGNNVFMAATGNMGSEDGTDVEEFDVALKSRLITVHHDAELHQWIDSYAEGNIHKDIVDFLKNKPTAFYPDIKESGGQENKDVITNPRTWTGLSKAIEVNFGKDATVNEYGDFVRKFGKNYIGSRSMELLKFVEENATVTLLDVLAGKADLERLKKKRDNQSEILREFEAIDPKKLKKKEQANLVKFLHSVKEVNQDALVGSIHKFGHNRMMELKDTDKATEFECDLAKEFKEEYEFLYNRDVEEEKNHTQAK